MGAPDPPSFPEEMLPPGRSDVSQVKDVTPQAVPGQKFPCHSDVSINNAQPVRECLLWTGGAEARARHCHFHVSCRRSLVKMSFRK